tara:strand:- start:36 stop:878 length:843 start_codon:yes stop_codon:yes gene_type:complete
MAWMAAISAGAGLASSLFGGSSRRAAEIDQAGRQYAAQIRAEGNQRAQAKFQNTFQNLMISAANERTKEIFGKRLDQYKQGQFYRSEAASIAFAANQTRLNEIYKAAKFGRLKDEKALAASIGSWNAADEGNRGRSFNLAKQKQNLAKFGIASSELTESLTSARIASQAADKNVARQLKEAEFRAYSQIAIPPTLQTNLPSPEFGPMAQLQLPSSNSGLSIASAALGAVSNFAANAPPGTFGNMFGGGGSPAGANPYAGVPSNYDLGVNMKFSGNIPFNP